MVDRKRRLPKGVAYLVSLGGIALLSLFEVIGVHIELWPFALSLVSSDREVSILISLVAVTLLSLLLRRQAEFYMLMHAQHNGFLLTTLGLYSLALGFLDVNSVLLMLGMIGIQYCLLATYQDEYAALTTFPMGLIVGCMVLAHPAFLVLLPILIYLLYPLRALSLRNVLGFILGGFVVAWLLLPLSLLIPQWGLWEHCLARWQELLEPANYWVSSDASWRDYLPWIVVVVQWLLGSALLSEHYAQESVRGRDSGSMLAQLSALLIVASFVGSREQGQMFVQLALVPLSIRTALLFTLYEVRINRIAFISYAALLVLLSLLH